MWQRLSIPMSSLAPSIRRLSRLVKHLARWAEKRRNAPLIKWFDSCDSQPRAIVQVSPSLQPNGVFVNYGDAVMWWACREHLQKRGWSVMCLPRERVHRQRLEAQAPALFIDCAGFIYSDAHHSDMRSARNASITTRNATSCRNVGAVIVSAPQTFGPFQGRPDGELNREMRRMIGLMHLICARDEVSAEYLGPLVPEADRSKVRIAPDFAFLYKMDSHEDGHRLLLRQGLAPGPQGRPWVGLSLNRQLHDRIPLYLDLMRRVIEFFKAKGAHVVLIPHEHGRFGRREKDDQFLCGHLARRSEVISLHKRGRLSRQAEESYIRSIEAAIGSLDFLVAGRFHAALRGLAEGIPTVTFSWSHKFETLFRSIGMSVERNVIPAEDLVARDAGEAVTLKLEEAWGQRDETREHLARAIPAIKKRAADYLDEILLLAKRR